MARRLPKVHSEPFSAVTYPCQGLGPRDGASDERADALTEAVDQLRSDAEIEWRDDVLERYYKDALAAE